MKSFFSTATQQTKSTSSSSNPIVSTTGHVHHSDNNNNNKIQTDINNSQKVLLDADKLIKEVHQFLDSLNPTSKTNQSVFDKLKNLNRRSSSSLGSQKLLLDKITQSESRLQSLSTDAVENKKLLTTNATEYYYRLQTCIDYNRELIPKQKEDLDTITIIFADIVTWVHYLQAMVKFHQEVIYQGQSAMTAPLMFSTHEIPLSRRNVTPNPKDLEEDMMMLHKLKKLKKVC